MMTLTPKLCTIVFLSTWVVVDSCNYASGEVVSQARSIPATTTDWSKTVSFAPFDSSLGTLISETLHATLGTHSTFAADYTTPSTIRLTAGPTVLDVGGMFSLTTPEAVRQADALSGTRIVFDPADGTATGSIALTPDPTGLVLPVSAVGHSTFFSSTGNGSGEVRTMAGVNLELDYCYLPPPPSAVVPEPMTLRMLVSGLGTIALVAIGYRRFS